VSWEPFFFQGDFSALSMSAETLHPNLVLPQRSVRLLSLNIAHARGLLPYQGLQSREMIDRQLDRIARLLRRENPDLVCLQEVDEASHWNLSIHLLDALREKAGFPHSYLGVHNRRAGPRPLAYGNGILSRFPIHQPRTFSFGEKVLGEKGFLVAEVEIDQVTLPIVNLHFDYRSRQKRVDQVNQVIHVIHESLTGHGLAPVICGDFNSARNRKKDAVEQLFGYILSHRRYSRFPDRGNTFPAPSPVRCLDFVFVPRPLRVKGCSIIRSLVSDHRPVRIDFDFGGALPGLTSPPPPAADGSRFP